MSAWGPKVSVKEMLLYVGQGSESSGKRPPPQSYRPESMIAPPRVVPLPQTILVRAEVRTSAPSLMAWLIPSVRVMSATSGRPWRCAISDTSGILVMVSRGLLSVSQKTSLVLSVMAASTSSALLMSTKVVVMPKRGRVDSRRLKVPP